MIFSPPSGTCHLSIGCDGLESQMETTVLLKSLIKEAISSTIYYFAHTLEGIQVRWSSNFLISIWNLNLLVLPY